MSLTYIYDQAAKGLDNLREPKITEELALTLDTNLQPALEVAGSLLQKADTIYDKEQEALAEGFNQEHHPTEELYVNRNG